MDVQVGRVFTKGDELVADAARASFDRQAHQYTDEQNQRLLDFLARAEPAHWAPYGHARYTIQVRNPDLSKLLSSPTLRTGLVVQPEGGQDAYLFTHSLWGWRNMLQAGVFTPTEYNQVCFALWNNPSIHKSLKALSIQASPLSEGRMAEQSHDDFTLRIRCPIVIARQLFKHQVGFVFSEASGRYIDYTTINRPLEWCDAPDNRKQGAGKPVGLLRHCAADLIMHMSHGFSMFAYWVLRKVVKVAPEQARYVMPMATDTTFVVTGHRLAWKRLLEQRLHSAAQQESAFLAEEIAMVLGGNCT